jgi:hypothetical protein
LQAFSQIYKLADMLGIQSLMRVTSCAVVGIITSQVNAGNLPMVLEGIYKNFADKAILRLAVTEACATNYKELSTGVGVAHLLAEHESFIWRMMGKVSRAQNKRVESYLQDAVKQACDDRPCSDEYCDSRRFNAVKVQTTPTGSNICVLVQYCQCNVECEIWVSL